MIIEVKWNETSSVTTASVSFKIEMNYEQVTNEMEQSGEIPFIKIANKVVDAAEKKHINNEYNVYNLPADNAALGISESGTGKVIVNEEGKTQVSLHDNKYCGLKKYYDNGIDVVAYSERCIPEVAGNLVKYATFVSLDNYNNTSITTTYYKNIVIKEVR